MSAGLAFISFVVLMTVSAYGYVNGFELGEMDSGVMFITLVIAVLCHALGVAILTQDEEKKAERRDENRELYFPLEG